MNWTVRTRGPPSRETALFSWRPIPVQLDMALGVECGHIERGANHAQGAYFSERPHTRASISAWNQVRSRCRSTIDGTRGQIEDRVDDSAPRASPGGGSKLFEMIARHGILIRNRPRFR